MSGNPRYVSGRGLEYRIVNIFKAKGYQATRTPGSKSPIDVFAGKNGLLICIQCKSGKSRLGKAGMIKLCRTAEQYGAPKALLVKRNKKNGKLTWTWLWIEEGDHLMMEETDEDLVEVGSHP